MGGSDKSEQASYDDGVDLSRSYPLQLLVTWGTVRAAPATQEEMMERMASKDEKKAATMVDHGGNDG